MRGNRYYDRPSPFSFGDTARIERSIKDEKEKFKRDELKTELRQEDRENEHNS